MKNQKTSLDQAVKQLSVIRLLDTLLENAINEQVSDIHLEPTATEIIVRYRVNGILTPAVTLPKNLHAGLIKRIKNLANLNENESHLPQEGRFKISSSQYKIAIKASLMPMYDGERAVLKLLNETTQELSLKELELPAQSLDSVKTALDKSNGLILVTGPAGSGKSTTLITIINALNNPSVNIATAEESIEHRLANINQSQVNQKNGFSLNQIVRSLLKQDSDIIMISELHEPEIANLAVQAALTGRLVLSSLVIPQAAAVPGWLSHLGLPPYLVANALTLIINQRLVRKVCKNCIHSYSLDKETLNQLSKKFDLKAVVKFLQAQGLISKNKDSLESVLFYRGRGCAKCGQTGYQGRVGIYEVMEITPQLVDLIINHAETAAIQEAAEAGGMITLAQNALMKATIGATSLEEILRTAIA